MCGELNKMVGWSMFFWGAAKNRGLEFVVWRPSGMYVQGAKNRGLEWRLVVFGA